MKSFFSILIGMIILSPVFALANSDIILKQNSDIIQIIEYNQGTIINSYNDTISFAGKEYYIVEKLEALKEGNISISLILDNGFVVQKEDIFPQEYELETDGEHIIINWNLQNKREGEAIAVFVTAHSSNKSNILLIVYLLSGILICLITYFLYLKFRKRKKLNKSTNNKENKKKEIIEKYLLETEKKIIEEIKKSEKKELWQKQLQMSTGFSKAKLSRLIRNLESRKIIEKIPLGNTNKIRLKK